MHLELSEDQEFFRATTRRFMADQTPLPTVRALHHDAVGFDRGWWRQAAELGWTAMLVSDDHGGGSLSGGPLADAVIVAEEAGRGLAPGPLLPVNVVASALDVAGGHGEVVARLLDGSAIAAWAIGEPGNRWRPGEFTTTATLRGGRILVDGVKAYVEAAGVAEHILVTARTGETLSQVLVPAGTDGVRVVPAASIDLGRRFAEVHLTDVELPLDAVVGEIGGASDAVERQYQIALALQCADTVGGLDCVFDFTLEYMNDRYAFGRPISSYQALKHRMADLLLHLETAKGCCDAAVAAFDQGRTDAGIEASVAKAYVASQALSLIQECMQFHGGISVTWEHNIHLYLRRATVNRAVLGSPEDHHQRICTLLGF